MTKSKTIVKDEDMEVVEENPKNMSRMETSTLSTNKDEYEELCQLVNAIAQPLASRKLAKKVYKLIKKASAQKDCVKNGLSDVQKALRKNDKGLVLLAGNVSPIDIYSHIPGLCEEKEWPYLFLPSREHLGLASGHKRPSIALLIKNNESYEALYNEIIETINSLVVDIEETMKIKTEP